MWRIARFIGFVFATASIVFIIVAAAVAAVVWIYEQGLPDSVQLQNYEPPVMTRVHAGDGSPLAEYAHERRLYLPSSAIPALVKEAFIFAEDKNFYILNGQFIDPTLLASSIEKLICGNRCPGGSSQDQPVARRRSTAPDP